MNFVESVEYLLSLGNEVSAMKLGLENISKLLNALENPQKNYLKVQVAGTNGKGSVCAFVDSICGRAGIKTGLYTSPHLISITERIKIGGTEISEEDFARHASTIRETSEKLVASGALESVPTFFEQITALALTVFAEKNVDLAILETGLGGRLDATTAANAEIAVITQIDYDHQEYLGETLAEVAAEKAAIIRAGSTAVSARQPSDAERVILRRCNEFDVVPNWATNQIIPKSRDAEKPKPGAIFATTKSTYSVAEIGLRGTHQLTNASVAIAVAETLVVSGFRITNKDICMGLETAKHPGRLEYVGDYLLDGAHNVAGVLSLRQFLEEFEPGPVTLIFGIMRDKDIEAIARILFPLASAIVLTTPDNMRAMPTADIAAIAPSVPARVWQTTTLKEAMDVAESETESGGIKLVTGSLYLVGEARKILNNR